MDYARKRSQRLMKCAQMRNISQDSGRPLIDYSHRLVNIALIFLLGEDNRLFLHTIEQVQYFECL